MIKSNPIDMKMYTGPANYPLLDMIPRSAKRILDVGCGSGSNMGVLTRRGHECIGVTISSAEYNKVNALGMKAILADCTQPLPFVPNSFDAIVFSHVLEHIPWPEASLIMIKTLLSEQGRVYVALPNIAFLSYRLRILIGSFPREKIGVFDETHLRWYTWDSARTLTSMGNYEIEKQDGDAWIRKIWCLPSVFGRILVKIRPNLFSKQLRIVLRPISTLPGS